MKPLLACLLAAATLVRQADAAGDDRHYEIVVFHCLEMNRTNCGETVLPLQSLPANPSAAYAQAQAIVAKWIAERPGLRLRGFDMRIGRGA